LADFVALLALNSKPTTVYSIPNFQPRPSKNQNETFFNFQAYGNIPSPPAVPSTTGFQNQGSGVRSESVAGDRRRKVPGFNEVEIGPGGTGRLGAILVSSGLGGLPVGRLVTGPSFRVQTSAASSAAFWTIRSLPPGLARPAHWQSHGARAAAHRLGPARCPRPLRASSGPEYQGGTSSGSGPH
jgi:hypothetical protein